MQPGLNRHGLGLAEDLRDARLGSRREYEMRVDAREPEAAEAAKRVHEAVDAELRYLDFEARGHFISRLYESAAGRLAHLD